MTTVRPHHSPAAATEPRPASGKSCTHPVRTQLLAACACLLGACASYQAKELVPEAELESLRRASLIELRVEHARPGEALDHDGSFDLTDGLNEAELVAVALTLNAGLRATRSELGEAEALLIQAGLWPNPEVGAAIRPEVGGGSTGFELDFLFELLRPGERKAKKSIANASVEEARARIVAEELRVAAEARRTRLAVLGGQASYTLLEQEAGIRREVVSLLKQRRELGEATVLDLHLAELELAEAERAARSARTELDSSRRALNRVLGLPPLYELPLIAPGEPLTFTVYADPEDSELDSRILSGRPDLAAKRAAYRKAEEELRLAVLRQYPSLKIGPSFERDIEGSEGLGLGALLELPLFDRNQGAIAEKHAARERVRAEFVALLHGLRAEAFDARERLSRARLEVETQQDETLPLVERSESAFEAAFRSRDISVFEWLTARGQALRARREFLSALLRYSESVVDLETVTGAPLSRPAQSQENK